MTTKNFNNKFKYTQQLGEQAEFLAEHWAVSSSFSWAF